MPREILSVKEVSREVNFSSVEKMVTLFVVALYSMYKKKYNRKFGDAFCCCFYSMYRMTMYAKKKIYVRVHASKIGLHVIGPCRVYYCMYACMHVFIHKHTHTYTHTHRMTSSCYKKSTFKGTC